MTDTWTWNTWDHVHCVQCGADLPKRPTAEPEHFCSIGCAYTYGVNFRGHMTDEERSARLAARAMQVPVIPEGWKLESIDLAEGIDEDGDGYDVFLLGPSQDGLITSVYAYASDPWDALRAAIKQANGGAK